MNEKKKQEIPMPFKFDDFFTTQNERDDKNKEKIENIDISLIDSFKNHPFKVVDNEDLISLKESIKINGILSPTIVRKKDDGRYEMLSGHRRKYACQSLGIDKIPCIIKELSNDEAIIYMVDSNLQREKILPSEKGFAYRMKLEALKHQGSRSDLTSVQVTQKSKKQTSRAKIGEEVGESQDKVRKYIRLTYLITEILDMVDSEQIALGPAVALSYLKQDEQFILLDQIRFLDSTPSLSQSIRLKQLSASGTLNKEMIRNVMQEIKPNQVPSLRVSTTKLKKLLPPNLKNNKEKENYVIKAVEFYGKYLSKKKLKEQQR